VDLTARTRVAAIRRRILETEHSVAIIFYVGNVTEIFTKTLHFRREPVLKQFRQRPDLLCSANKTIAAP
jgi:hypothetical protein